MNGSGAINSRTMMNNILVNRILGDGLSKITSDEARKPTMKLLPAPGNSDKSLAFRHSRVQSVLSTVNKLVKGKLSLGAEMKSSGMEQVFKRIFTVKEEELFLRASKCCLSTTAGPIAGRLFISTDKLAFCSDKPIAKVSSPAGESVRFHYKIVIPMKSIKRTRQTENMKKPSQKYMQVVTTDEYEFWFTGFLKYKKTFRCLQQAISQGILY